MRVEARRALIVDSAIGLILAVTSWIASFYAWGRAELTRPDWGHGPPGRVITTVDSSPWVLPAVIVLALGIATRRVWPRTAFVATVAGAGTYLATGAMFGPILAPGVGLRGVSTMLCMVMMTTRGSEATPLTNAPNWW